MAMYAKASTQKEDAERQVIMAWATCPLDRADDLARTLVEERLAACVNVTAPLVSVYRWQADVCRDEERLLIIKTTSARQEAMTARLLELHPYDVPELLFLPVDGSVPYLDWVRSSVADGDAPEA